MENCNEHGQNERILHCECAHKTGCVLERTINEKKFSWMVGKDRKLLPLRNRDVSWQKRGEKSQNTTLVYNEEIKYLYKGWEQFDWFRQNFLECFFNYVNPVILSHKLLSSFCPVFFCTATGKEERNWSSWENDLPFFHLFFLMTSRITFSPQ